MTATAFDWGPLLARGPLFIGILNLTPDSFSDGGRHATPEAALDQARRLVAAGAGMLDLGAESTRPGAQAISVEAEWERLEAPLALIRRSLPEVPLSLDTRHAPVAARGLRSGVSVLNDVAGFSDSAMLDLASATGCGLIAMRSRPLGDGFLMPPYKGPAPTGADRALGELARVRERLLAAGVAPGRVLLDPGFGFGTTFQEDLALWATLGALPRRLDWPADRVCIGVSRKRYLAWRAGVPELPPEGRDGLTAAAHQEAMALGYRIFRTHAIG